MYYTKHLRIESICKDCKHLLLLSVSCGYVTFHVLGILAVKSARKNTQTFFCGLQHQGKFMRRLRVEQAVNSEIYRKFLFFRPARKTLSNQSRILLTFSRSCECASLKSTCNAFNLASFSTWEKLRTCKSLQIDWNVFLFAFVLEHAGCQSGE